PAAAAQASTTHKGGCLFQQRGCVSTAQPAWLRRWLGVLSGGCAPLFRREVGDVEARLGFPGERGWELAAHERLQVGPERDLEHKPRGRVLAQGVADRRLAVEERAERTAGQNAVVEAVPAAAELV